MNSNASIEGKYINFSHLGDFAGTIIKYALHSLDSLSPGTWILDTVASNHICSNLNLISNPTVLKNFTNHFPDGSTQLVHIGNVIKIAKLLSLDLI